MVSTDLEWVGNIINSDSYISMWTLVVLLLVEEICMKQWVVKCVKIVDSWDYWGLYELCRG